jgi:hypothetical protein
MLACPLNGELCRKSIFLWTAPKHFQRGKWTKSDAKGCSCVARQVSAFRTGKGLSERARDESGTQGVGCRSGCRLAKARVSEPESSQGLRRKGRRRASPPCRSERAFSHRPVFGGWRMPSDTLPLLRGAAQTVPQMVGQSLRACACDSGQAYVQGSSFAGEAGRENGPTTPSPPALAPKPPLHRALRTHAFRARCSARTQPQDASSL